MSPTPILRHAFALLLALSAMPALAVNYVFPGTLPAGCSGSGGTYACGALALGNSDTITIAAPQPATITVNGNLDVGRSTINAAGVAGNLTLVVTGSLSVGNGGQINGNVSAASMANPGGRANIGGSLTTTGALSLGNSAAVAQCVQSTGAAAITLANNAAIGAVCCGALGSCTNSCVTNNSGAAMPALCSGGPGVTAGRFNAFEATTAAGSVSGVIKTKVSGTAATLAIVAVNTAGTGVATTFTGNVKVEVLDASNNTGALDSSTNCRSTWAVASGTSATTVSFASGDQGRKNVTLTVAEAFRDARIRVSHPDTGSATVIGCSSDNFAIRPASFGSFTATDSNSSTAGTTRALANTTTSGVVHKAGRPFTVRATAMNSAGVTTARYTGSPSAVPTACTGGVCGGTLGTASYTAAAATAGAVTTTASYSEAGAFGLQLVDSGFAAVDASDSTTAERNITSSVLTIGRFIPDHFTVVDAPTTPGYTGPRLKTFNSSTCGTRSFTYLGQPFGYATLPQAVVTAVNASGGATSNYSKFGSTAFTVAQAYAVGASAPGLTTVTSAPTVTPGTGGTARLTGQAADRLTMTRPVNAPVTNFSANVPTTAISLTWSASDNSETLTGSAGNESITTPTPLLYSPLAFDQGNGEFRYGVLKLASAYGSELLALAVPLETQYWNGSSFVTNTADQCTTLPASSVALGNFRGGLAACETAPAAASVSFVNGRGLLRMQAPGTGNAGSVDASLQLGTTITAGALRCSAVGATASAAVAAGLPWLQARLPGGSSFDQNPSARISFGQYRSPVIYQREVY